MKKIFLPSLIVGYPLYLDAGTNKTSDIMKKFDNLPEKFKGIPREKGEMIISRNLQKFGDYEAVLEFWYSSRLGGYGRSLVFHEQDLGSEPYEEIGRILRNHIDITKLSISRGKDAYIFATYSFYEASEEMQPVPGNH